MILTKLAVDTHRSLGMKWTLETQALIDLGNDIDAIVNLIKQGAYPICGDAYLSGKVLANKDNCEKIVSVIEDHQILQAWLKQLEQEDKLTPALKDTAIPKIGKKLEEPTAFANKWMSDVGQDDISRLVILGWKLPPLTERQVRLAAKNLDDVAHFTTLVKENKNCQFWALDEVLKRKKLAQAIHLLTLGAPLALNRDACPAEEFFEKNQDALLQAYQGDLAVWEKALGENAPDWLSFRNLKLLSRQEMVSHLNRTMKIRDLRPFAYILVKEWYDLAAKVRQNDDQDACFQAVRYCVENDKIDQAQTIISKMQLDKQAVKKDLEDYCTGYREKMDAYLSPEPPAENPKRSSLSDLAFHFLGF